MKSFPWAEHGYHYGRLKAVMRQMEVVSEGLEEEGRYFNDSLLLGGSRLLDSIIADLEARLDAYGFVSSLAEPQEGGASEDS